MRDTFQGGRQRHADAVRIYGLIRRAQQHHQGRSAHQVACIHPHTQGSLRDAPKVAVLGRSPPSKTIYYALPATKADKFSWKVSKSKYSNPPPLVIMIPSSLIDSEGFHLDNELEVPQMPTPLNTTPGYILEHYWTDIITVLSTTDICRVRKLLWCHEVRQPTTILLERNT